MHPPRHVAPLVVALFLHFVFTNLAAAEATGAEGASSGPPVLLAETDPEEPPEKKRVKKDEPKKKAEEQTTQTRSTAESEGGGLAGCFGGCLGSFFAGLVSSDPEPAATAGDEVVTVPAQLTPTTTGGGAAAASDLRPLPYRGVVNPLNPHADDVGLWDLAGGRERPADEVARLAAGEYVEAVERVTYEDVVWVRVAVPAMSGAGGWIREHDLDSAEPAPGESSAALAAVPGAEPKVPIGPPRTEILALAALPISTESSINEEYRTAWEVGVEGRVFPQGTMNVQLGVAYLYATGDPKFNYEVGPITDSSSDSRLDVWRFDVGFGQEIYFSGKDGYLDWGIGPSLFRVRERADITVLDSGGTAIDRREEKLEEWRFGGQARLGGGGVVGRFAFTFYGRFALISWNAKQEKSLTLDFVDSRTIAVFSLGLTASYRFL